MYIPCMENEPRIRVNYALSPEAVRLLTLLAQKMGVSRTAVIELALRQMAKSEQIE